MLQTFSGALAPPVVSRWSVLEISHNKTGDKMAVNRFLRRKLYFVDVCIRSPTIGKYVRPWQNVDFNTSLQSVCSPFRHFYQKTCPLPLSHRTPNVQPATVHDGTSYRATHLTRVLVACLAEAGATGKLLT